MKSFVKFRPKQSRRRQSRRFSPWQSALERLEDRTLLVAATVVNGILTDLDTGASTLQTSTEQFFQLNPGGRWTTTTTNPVPLVQGDPTILTWGIVLDGTTITPDGAGGASESSDASSLIAFFDSLYGAGVGGSDLTLRPWFSIFNDSFDRIEALSGIDYVYQPITTSQTIQTIGGSATTPDILIGAHSIDGAGDTLAYNQSPANGGDMVLDTGNPTFYDNRENSSRAARNTIMHEAGHGLGVAHVASSNAAFLMETTISPSPTFDGPQLDDILAYHRLYGDALEKGGGNDSIGTATNLGTIGNGSTVSRGMLGSTTSVSASQTDFVSIDDETDVDIFRFTVTTNSAVTLTLTPRGTTYSQGQVGGTEASFNSVSQSDLTLQLIDNDGSTILQTANASGLGGTERITAFSLDSAGTYFVRVSGATTDKIQLYGLDATVSLVNDAPSFTKGSNQKVEVTAGPQTVPGWATAISAGPADESDQTLTFNVTTNNDSLFAVLPAISSDGTLTFTPAKGFGGIATVTVSLKDNGGTANGGVDLSPAQTFTITTFVPNVTYSATSNARLRACVVNGQFQVQINGVPHNSYFTSEIETLTFNGGSKNDEIDLTGLSPVLYPNLTRVVIKGGAGNDRVIGSFASDSIDGGAGNDTLTGGDGDDTLIGNAGTDLLMETATANLDLNDTVLTGLGFDRLVTIENALLTADDNALGRTIDAGDYTRGSVTLIGGAGSDILTGGSKNDSITGRDGDDVLTGGGGNDTVLGGFGFDMLNGDAGNDLLIGGFDDDIIDGGDGRDTVAGGNGGSARGGDGVADAGDAIMNSEVISEAFKKLFAFE